MSVTVNITNKEYVNETGILLAVNFSVNINGEILNLRYGLNITEMNLEDCQPFMEVDDDIIRTWLVEDISRGIQQH